MNKFTTMAAAAAMTMSVSAADAVVITGPYALDPVVNVIDPFASQNIDFFPGDGPEFLKYNFASPGIVDATFLRLDRLADFMFFIDGVDRTGDILMMGNSGVTSLPFDMMFTFEFSSASGPGDIDFVVSAVPLPASALLLLSGLAGFGFLRARRGA